MVRSSILGAAAIAAGITAWGGEPRLLPAAMLFPALWALAPTRLGATLVAAGYFLAASRGLPQGVSNFYDSGFEAGIALWIAASVLFVAAHALAWTARTGRVRSIRYALAAIMLSLPPIGILGWAHPIAAAGILFPRWGWVGLAFAAIILLSMTSRWWTFSTLLLAPFWIWSVTHWWVPEAPAKWVGVDTQFAGSNGHYADYRQHQLSIDRALAMAEAGAAVVVLPESALGRWTPTIERFWMRALKGRDVTVYGGAVIVNETGYDSVMIEVTNQGASVGYRQRMPVPVSMWQPWLALIGGSTGARADFFLNPVVEVRGMTTATLVCYEQLLVWPILQSAMRSPNVLVAASNGWWTDNTAIVAVQVAATIAWARLFDLSLVFAINI